MNPSVSETIPTQHSDTQAHNSPYFLNTDLRELIDAVRQRWLWNVFADTCRNSQIQLAALSELKQTYHDGSFGLILPVFHQQICVKGRRWHCGGSSLSV